MPPRAAHGGDLGSGLAKLLKERLWGTRSHGAGGKTQEGAGIRGGGRVAWQPRRRQQLTPDVFIRR